MHAKYDIPFANCVMFILIELEINGGYMSTCMLTLGVNHHQESTYSSVLNNRPVTFFTKSAWISLLSPDSQLNFCPYYYSAP